MSRPEDPHPDFEKGLERRREVLGDAWVDRALGSRNSFNAELQSLITRFAWNEIWTRPGLTDEARRLLVLAFTIAQGRWEEYDLHFRSAVEHGVPAANTAFHRAEAVLSALGRPPG